VPENVADLRVVEGPVRDLVPGEALQVHRGLGLPAAQHAVSILLKLTVVLLREYRAIVQCVVSEKIISGSGSVFEGNSGFGSYFTSISGSDSGSG